MFWWATYDTGVQRFVLADGEEAAQRAAAKHGTVTALQTLPYPPQQIPKCKEFPEGFPGFCYSPARCAGHTSCPRQHACTE